MNGNDGSEASQADLLSGFIDLDSVRYLIADLHDDLPGRVQRFRYLLDLGGGGALGPGGTM